MTQIVGILGLLSAALLNRGFIIWENPATFALVGLLAALGLWSWRHRLDWDTPATRFVAAAFILVEAAGFRLEIYFLGSAANAWALPIATLISLAASIYFPKAVDYVIVLLLIWMVLIPSSMEEVEPWGHVGLLTVFITCVASAGILMNFGFNGLVRNLIENGEIYRRLSEVDYLTGVYNRRAFLGMMEGAAETGHYVFVMIDIDHFKRINDRLGHAAGDDVLVAFAKLLIGLPGNFECGRLGGEEFGLFAIGGQMDEVKARLAEISKFAMAQPVAFAFSAGAVCGKPGRRISDVLREADEQLYIAKRSGKAQLCSSGHTLLRFGANYTELGHR